jgi:hypothetical protein
VRARSRVRLLVVSHFMKQHFLLLATLGFLALAPTESKAQVSITVSPGYSNHGYYYQGQPYYYRGHHRYYNYHHNQRYYRWHRYND